MSKPIVILSAVGPDGKTWSVPVCPKCRRTCLDERQAEECCEPTVCKCGNTCGSPWTICDKCLEKKHQEKEREMFEKAKKVPQKEYVGPVFDRDHSEWYPSVDEMIERLFDDLKEIPKYAWAATINKLSLNAQSIVDNALEDHHEDAEVDDNEVKKLQSLLDEWCASQGVESWEEDTSTVVLIDPVDDED